MFWTIVLETTLDEGKDLASTYLDVGCTPVLLDKDPEEELSLLAGLEGGGDDAVAALGQPQPLAHLAQVDERVSSVHLET